jgi:PEP-CTERM motif-containing protein
MKLGVTASSAVAGVLAIAGVVAVSPAQAALQKVAVDLNVYDTSAVDPTPNQTLGVMTVMDLVGGGVSVDFALAPLATLFASTGGGHITVGFNLDTTITSGDITITSPTGAGAPTFTFKSPVNGVPGPSGGFGNFSAGLKGDWSGTSNHFAGPIDFTIAGVSVSDFEANAKGFFAVADVLGSNGTGEAGGKIETTISQTIVGTPEPSTWAMMLLGFAGLGFAGYRKAHSARTALPAA